jgi:hypothetical protein
MKNQSMKTAFFILLVPFSLFSCNKGSNPAPVNPIAKSLPTVTTELLYSLTDTTVTTGGNVSSDGGATVTARGVCWGS